MFTVEKRKRLEKAFQAATEDPSQVSIETSDIRASQTTNICALFPEDSVFFSVPFPNTSV